MSIKLYDMTENYLKVWDMMQDEDIDLGMIEDTLECIEAAIEEKAVNIVSFTKSLQGGIDTIKAEEKRLAARRKALENKHDGIKGYLKLQLERAGLSKIKTDLCTITLQKNPPALSILDEKLVPPRFLTVIPERYEVDNKEVKDALKRGEEIPGVELTQGTSLRIR